MLIKTHNGMFHADEVFACALLKLCFKDKEIKIIRTRNNTIKADLYIDIGGKFDNISYFDHHFPNFNHFHDIQQTIPKASFGLIWDKFAYLLGYNEKILTKIKNMIVIPIDAHDNNIRLCKYNEANYNPYTISNIISAFNRKLEDNVEDLQFNKALNFAIEALQNIIYHVENTYNDEDILRNIFDSQPNSRYIILDKYYKYANAIKDKKYSHITHLIFQERGYWRAICIRDNKSKELKAPFPISWGGLTDKELSDIANIPGCIFCHIGCWFAINKTKDGIIKMVEKCFN